MRILYLNYGSQSGVTAVVVRLLRSLGHDVIPHDPVEKFLYRRRVGRLRLPNVAPEPVVATALAMARFRRDWKEGYAHTCWAFDRLTARCERASAATAPDVVLQAGVLFGPGRRARAPYFLFCDHTRAIAEAYPKLRGLPPTFPFDPRWRRREEAVYRGAEAVFSMSAYVKRSLVETYGVEPGRVHVVGAGPTVVPAPGSAPARRERAFLFVGSDFVRKGGADLLAAFGAVRARHPDAELWMAGGNQPAAAPPGVRLLGRLGGPQLASLYARASAFVLPTYREPFGIAFLEAMAFGLPCVGSAIEAIPEIVEDGVTGAVVAAGDRGALARAMLQLVDDPERARALGEAGRARVAECFGWERAVGRMADVMRGAAPFTARAG